MNPSRGSLGVSAVVAAIPIVVLFLMLGRAAKAGVDVGAGGARVGAARRAGRLRHAGAAGADLGDLRRGVRAVPDRLDRVQLDHAVSAGGRYRQVRDHQGLGRRPDRRSPAAGDVHRVLVRRVHRGRGRIRRAGRGLGRDARRPRLQSVLRRRHLPARQHRAGRVRIDRHSGDHARQRDRACRCWR